MIVFDELRLVNYKFALKRTWRGKHELVELMIIIRDAAHF